MLALKCKLKAALTFSPQRISLCRLWNQKLLAANWCLRTLRMGFNVKLLCASQCQQERATTAAFWASGEALHNEGTEMLGQVA